MAYGRRCRPIGKATIAVTDRRSRRTRGAAWRRIARRHRGMPYASLRDFIARLEASRRLVRVTAPVSPFLEMTEIQTRLLAEGGPAALFENVTSTAGGTYAMPVLVNLFGTVERVAWGMDREPGAL